MSPESRHEFDGESYANGYAKQHELVRTTRNMENGWIGYELSRTKRIRRFVSSLGSSETGGRHIDCAMERTPAHDESKGDEPRSKYANAGFTRVKRIGILYGKTDEHPKERPSDANTRERQTLRFDSSAESDDEKTSQ